MHVPGQATWRSIKGRLYVALGLTLAGLIATNAHTAVYAGLVAHSARSIATISFDGLRAVDAFDELLDEHRDAVMAAINSAAGDIGTMDAVANDELAMLDTPGMTDPVAGLPGEVLSSLRRGVTDLGSFARKAIQLAADSGPGSAEALAAKSAYIAQLHAMESAIAVWRTQLREAVARELNDLNGRATFMQRIELWLIAGGCAIGALAALISGNMLSRLEKLTAAMLSLASGNLATVIPCRGDRDEIGRLAHALDIFRDNAGLAMTSEANLNVAFENMVEGILVFSPERAVVLHNPRAVQILGLPCHDCCGITAQDILEHLAEQRAWPQEMVRELEQRVALAGSRKGGRKGGEGFELVLPDGRSYAVTASVLPNRNTMISFEDTSDRRASAARIAHLAHHDMLTELPNRAMFQDRLSAAVDDAVHYGGIAVALLICDLDRFKEVNDTYGHPVGDELLCQVAERMRETMRRTDVVARLGGDEFAIVHLVGGEQPEAYGVAERVVTALSEPFEIQGNKVCIGVSIGIACAPRDATNLTDLMKRADLALYAAKQGGRNRFVAYDATMAERLEERRAIATEIRKALDSNGFHLCYQPQVDLRTRRILGFEALARWNHPIRGPIGPVTFIPIAEENGLIVQLGEWALRTACREAADWEGDTRVSVNVSPQQLHEEGFIDTVRQVLRETGLPADRLELEITETAMLSDGEKMLGVLETLRSLGVHLALDDFGTGYSALSYLQKFPFDKIKIDKSFISQLGDKEESDAIVRAVAGLGANLGIPTIAEGVETEEQAQRVLLASCDEGQGYLFSRPIPASVVRKILADEASLCVAVGA